MSCGGLRFEDAMLFNHLFQRGSLSRVQLTEIEFADRDVHEGIKVGPPSFREGVHGVHNIRMNSLCPDLVRLLPLPWPAAAQAMTLGR
jgi:hypothetical protein